MRLKDTKRNAKYFEDQTAFSEPEQRKRRWLSQQHTSESGLAGFEPTLMRMGMSVEDLYLLRAKLLGNNKVPDFNKPLDSETLTPLGRTQTGPDPFGMLKKLLGRR